MSLEVPMRDAYTIPDRDMPKREERPYLEAPRPAWLEPCPKQSSDEEEAEEPRVIIIDI